MNMKSHEIGTCENGSGENWNGWFLERMEYETGGNFKKIVNSK